MIHKITKKQNNSKMCFVCGLKNSLGLKSRFYETENNELVALFTPGEEHQSYPGRVHGGVVSAVLDEVMFRAASVGKPEEIWGVTIDLSLKYRKPLPLNEELKAVARVTSENSRMFEATGEIYLPTGELAVSATGKYFKTPISKITKEELNEMEWRLHENGDDPKEVEV
jgi:uncharacterized protein (TIGR00369 family)